MKITQFAIDRPVTTSMLFLALVIFGMMTYFSLAVNLFPELKLPVISISTYNVGTTPEEIEKEITDKIEEELSTLSGLKELKSYSMPDLSQITVQFEHGIDPDIALNEVKSKLDLVIPGLPKEAERPLVQKFKLSDIPVIDIVVSSDNLSGNQLYDYANRVLKNRLSQLKGVSNVILEGGEQREIRILVDKSAMYELEMNIPEVSDFMGATNVQISGGDYVTKDRISSIEIGEKFPSVSAISEVPVVTRHGTKLIKEFATVVDTVKDNKGKALYYDVKANQKYGNIVSLSIMKTTEANSVQVAQKVKELIGEISPGLPDGLDVSIPFDTSEYVESSVDDALINIVLGIIITGLILFFFLNDVRTTVIVSISIPVSLLGTFMAISSFGGSLNMMTLMSFSVAIGALVSNSIVVIENIIRLRNEGMDIKEAAVKGTREVMMAVIASTGTNLVVFLPIATMTSITGAFFKEYALTISAATVFSLIVSFMLTPMLASILLKKQRPVGKLAKLSMRFFEVLEAIYAKSLARLISRRRNPLILFGIMMIIFISSFELLKVIGFEFEPQEDDSEVYVQMEMPSGTAVKRTEELVKWVEDEIGRFEEVKSVLTIIGKKNESTLGTHFANAKIKLVAKSERALSDMEFAQLLEERLALIPEIRSTVSAVNADDGAPIQFFIKSDSQEDLAMANASIKGILQDVTGILNFESSLREGNPLIRFEPDGRLLADLGLSPLELSRTIRNSVNGAKVSVYKERGKEYDITLSYPNNQINSVEKIKQIPIFTDQGSYTVGQLATVHYETSAAQIQHDYKTRTVEFTANLSPGALQGDVQNSINKLIERTELPGSVTFAWAGNIKELNEATVDMTITFFIAFLLMYMLLASIMENFWHPVIIFTTVPMAMIGVFVFMFLFGSTMNIMSLMAIITLLGLVVNDDILIHDYTEQLMHNKKMDIYDATIKAGRTKMKTVIMTTVAIIFGMLPNALGIGDAGAEFRTPMAIVTIGGMITSTILTLYLIPSIFYVIRSPKRK